jgi:hypothetical protein
MAGLVYLQAFFSMKLLVSEKDSGKSLFEKEVLPHRQRKSIIQINKQHM